MIKNKLNRSLNIISRSVCDESAYTEFLQTAFDIFARSGSYLAPCEDINCLELAHLIPEVAETMLAIYIGINDAVCNKALMTAVLPQHSHNNVFVYDPQIYSGGRSVPEGTVDAKQLITCFEPPSDTWNSDWTYVMAIDGERTAQSLWKENGYIDTIPAKLEDFTLISDHNESKVCFYIAEKAFSHPVNASRPYLKDARNRGEKLADEFTIPEKICDEFGSLVPVVLCQGEKLYVATTDISPCPHGWTNIHPNNTKPAFVHEISAVPIDIATNKPPVDKKYHGKLKPPAGSADMTTDCFKRGTTIWRKPVLEGNLKG